MKKGSTKGKFLYSQTTQKKGEGNDIGETGARAILKPFDAVEGSKKPHGDSGGWVGGKTRNISVLGGKKVNFGRGVKRRKNKNPK